jgi:hypothetical protein
MGVAEHRFDDLEWLIGLRHERGWATQLGKSASRSMLAFGKAGEGAQPFIRLQTLNK